MLRTQTTFSVMWKNANDVEANVEITEQDVRVAMNNLEDKKDPEGQRITTEVIRAAGEKLQSELFGLI